MATPQDIQLQQALNDELQETNSLANELVNSYRNLTKDTEDLFKSESDRLKLKRKEKELSKDISKDVLKSLRSQKMDSETILDLEKKRLSGTLRIKDVNTLIEKSKAKQEAIVDRLHEAVIEELIDTKKAADLQEKITAEYIKQQNVLKKLAGEAEQLEKKLGITYKIFEGIAKIPILSSLIKIEKVKEAMEDAANNTSSAFKVFNVGVGATFTQIGKSLRDPLIILGAQIALIKKFYDLYGGVNKRIVEQGKQLNISKEQSEAIYNRSLQYAASQRDAFVTGARITEGREKLNAVLGTTIDFTDKEAITAEKLSHYYGITEEQNAHIAMFARETGQTNIDILNTVLKTAANQKAQIGGSLSYQKILQKVSSVSGDILTRFKGNVRELTKAVQQADKLGLTLEQVDKVGESLLNFEQSIESELKAELLTGKALNLEKARSAALSGDTVKLTNEIAKQVGNIHQFEKLNTIQRQAYAEAFGMTASEMGDMLRKRELEAKLGVNISKDAEKALKLADEKGIKIEDSIRKELEAKTLADLQKYTFEKIKTILEKIASGPMATIFKYLEKGLKFVEGIFGTFSKMTGGALGNALGTAILAAPLLLSTTRLMAGGLRGLLFQRGTDANPMVTRPTMVGGMGGGIGSFFGGGKTTLPSGAYVQGGQAFNAAGKPLTGAAATSVMTAAGKQGRGFGAFSPKAIGVGMGLGIGGMALSGIASSMQPGAGASAMGILGQTASYAGMGAMFGPWGAAIGGLVGLGMGVFNLSKENEERRKQEAEEAKENQRKTNDLMQQFLDRPIHLNMNNDTILKFNTNSNLYGNQQSIFN